MRGDFQSRLRRSLRRRDSARASIDPTEVEDFDQRVADEIDAELLEETPEDAIFLDLETTGLRADRSLTSLIGILYRENDSMRLEQWYSGDVVAERRQLQRLQQYLGRFRTIVSYNGNGFDVPFLRTRWRWHRIADPTVSMESLDLLVPVRKKYRGRWSDCRLATVERELLGLPRCAQDLPGSEAPLRFQDLREGGPVSLIEPVLLHNRRDLMSLVALRKVLLGVTITDQEAAASGGQRHDLEAVCSPARNRSSKQEPS